MITFGNFTQALIKRYPKAFAPEKSPSHPSHPRITAEIAALFMGSQPMGGQQKKKPKKLPRS